MNEGIIALHMNILFSKVAPFEKWVSRLFSVEILHQFKLIQKIKEFALIYWFV
jgi:hypothetical protein